MVSDRHREERWIVWITAFQMESCWANRLGTVTELGYNGFIALSVLEVLSDIAASNYFRLWVEMTQIRGEVGGWASTRTQLHLPLLSMGAWRKHLPALLSAIANGPCHRILPKSHIHGPDQIACQHLKG